MKKSKNNKIIKKDVILNLIQDLPRLPLTLLNHMRGRCQIKFGMTTLFDNGAFTLIELLVVVLIIGILAAVAVPQYQKAVEKSRAMQAVTIVKAIGDAQEAYFLANGNYADNLDKLDIEIPGKTYTFANIKSKYYGMFDFAATNSTGTIIARSQKFEAGKNHNGNYMQYSLRRFPKDSSIYCLGEMTGDPYKICKGLSGGKRKTIDGTSYYVVQ